MKPCFPILIAAALCLASPAVMARTPSDFVYFDAQIAALQHRIDGFTVDNALKPEVVQDLQAKQQELIDREAKLKQEGKLTADEKTAMGFSIREQQQRLAHFTQAAAPKVKRVDPASLPAPTYVEPNGTTITTAPGQSPQQNGVIQVPTPTVPVIHSPAAPTVQQVTPQQ